MPAPGKLWKPGTSSSTDYNLLKAQYSKRKGQARLDGQVVDSEMLRAYESHDSAKNCIELNPFSEKPGTGPAEDLPIHIMCDFNPVKRCIWELGNSDSRHTYVSTKSRLRQPEWTSCIRKSSGDMVGGSMALPGSGMLRERGRK